MSASGRTFQEMRSLPQKGEIDNQYFEWLSDMEFENNIHEKYGYGLHATMKLATGDTASDDGSEYLMGTTTPNIRDLNNLFTIDEEDNSITL